MGLHFDFSSEQRMLAESVRGLLAREARESMEATGSALAGHGVFGLVAPEDAGGLGLGLTEALAVAIETGRAQAPYPVIETILCAALLSRLRPAAAADVLRGTAIATCATAGEAEAGAAVAGRIRLRGRVVAPFADRARWLAVPVRRTDRNEPGRWAALVDLAQPGAKVSPAPVFDLTYPLARIDIDLEIETADVVEEVLTSSLAVLAAGELTGAAEFCFDASVRHLKERVQFGKAIGMNQALRHAAADDWVRVQGMRAASEYAAAAFDVLRSDGGAPLSAEAFRHAAHVAKAYCSGAAREVAEHAIQIHGGIGFTWEFGLHVPLRRILRLASSHGTASDHQDALAVELLRRNNGVDA